MSGRPALSTPVPRTPEFPGRRLTGSVSLQRAGDPGAIALMGAVTVEECGLAPDPVRQRLTPTVGQPVSLATDLSAS